MAFWRDKDLLLLKGNVVSKSLADSVSDYLDLEYCDRVLDRYPDGEIRCHVKQNVRGKDCFVIQSTCRADGKSVNESLVELLFMISTLKRASAGRITAVLPYYGYARQDRKQEGRVPISAKDVADFITKAGADRVLTVDLHAGQIQGFFDIPVDNLIPNKRVIVPAASKLIKEEIDDEDNIKFGAPDVGGAERADDIAEEFNAPLVIVYKRRKNAEETEVRKVIGKIKPESTIVLVDDIASTLGTLTKAASVIKQIGAKEVWAIVTHGMFAPPAVKRIRESPIEKVLATDTIPALEKTRNCEQIQYVGMGNMLGEVIERIHEGKSVSEAIEHT